MKVIQLTSFFKPSFGGVEKQVEEIAQHLFESGVNVEVFTTDASHGSKRRFSKEECNQKFEYQVLRFRYWLGFGYFFRVSPVLLFKLLFGKFDIIHVHNIHDAHLLGAIIIKIIRRKKLVVTGHNPYIIKEEKRGKVLNFGVKFYEFVLKFFIRFIDAYVALVKSERKFVNENLKIKYDKIFVIPNGIQDIYFEKDKPEKSTHFDKWNINRKKWKLVAGAICRMDFVKGLQNLKLAADKLKDVLFIFVGGDGGYLNHLKTLYKDNKNVFFTERYLPFEEAKQFYNEIDVFVLPSVYEPFGITTVEAMTQGKYILASNNGGTKEIVNDEFGELLKPEDQEKWAKRIEYCRDNQDKIIQEGKKAVKFAQQYKWENVIELLMKVYDKLG